MTPISSDSVGWDTPLGISPLAGSSQGEASQRSRRGWLSEAQCWQLAQGHKQFYLGGYRLLGWIGSGGMGQVFRAQDLRLNRTVALKVLAPSAPRRAMQRFLREMRAAGALRHPHIVETLDADADGDVQFLVMELAPGMDLRRWLNRHGPLPAAWACECVRQAALALDYAHQQGILHRDVKPANLAADARNLQSRPHAKVLDLGLARFVDPGLTSLTGLHQRIGTPEYMAPELGAGGGLADRRSEVFALGATLFELLSGAPPEPGETSVLRYRPQTSHALAAVITRMLAADPSQRYATAAEAAAALEPHAWDAAGGEALRPAAQAQPMALTMADALDEPQALSMANVLDDELDRLEPSASMLGSLSRVFSRSMTQLASASFALASALIGLASAPSPSAQLRDWIEADRRHTQVALAMAAAVAVLTALILRLAG